MRLAATPLPHTTPEPSLYVAVQKNYFSSTNARFQLDVTFTAQPGVTILLGHSGAGKTTLLRSIAGLCNPQRGRIVSGEKVLFDSEKKIIIEPSKRHVGFVFQDLALFPHLTVEENVAYGLRKLQAKDRDQKVREILESFQITSLCRRVPREISGGEQQRVALARSLVMEPSVLLLDEPLSSLDAHTKAGIIDDLRAWNDTHRIPMLYVTHNHEEVFALGERVISLEKGRITAEGSPVEMVAAPYRHSMAQIQGFENLFEAVMSNVRESQGTMTCRLLGSPIEIRMPSTRVAPSVPTHLGIRSDEILLATSKPAVLHCNVIHGRIQQIDHIGRRVELWIDSGLTFRVNLNEEVPKTFQLRSGDDVWMIIRPQACHLIRTKRLRALQRLFVFICSRNTSRSPIAQALCNDEVARRLRVPQYALGNRGFRAVSAGLNANPGDSMAIEAQEALHRLNVPIPAHRSQNFTTELAARAELIFCMTQAQRQTAIKMFPEVAPKVVCLRPGLDLEDPHNAGTEDFIQLARCMQGLIRDLIDQLVIPLDTPESA
ncbi:MAG: ATP-binding cassette domain-containing protein [Acidobacteriia bacterium]|nr:ATP-binding cassette domain-containing protein [Terriglobia bacterium]